MADEPTAHEQALRKLPLPYSLALRLRDAGVSPNVICEYVGIEEAALHGVYRIAEAKLLAARGLTRTPARDPVKWTPRRRHMPRDGDEPQLDDQRYEQPINESRLLAPGPAANVQIETR